MPIRCTCLLAALLMMAGVGCDDAATPGGQGDARARDVGPTPVDMAPGVDMQPTVDRGPPDDRGPINDAGDPPDGAPDPDPDAGIEPDSGPDAAAEPTPGAPGVLAGGARRATERFRLAVSVGGPSPTAARQSPRFRARIGVGSPSLATPGAP